MSVLAAIQRRMKDFVGIVHKVMLKDSEIPTNV